MTTGEMDAKWTDLQERTRRANVVREAIHLLDVSWHDLDITLRWLRDHKANDDALDNAIADAKTELGRKSDNYQSWLNKEQPKIDRITAELSGE